MVHNIPTTQQKRVVIIGAGFGGLILAEKLIKSGKIQVVLIDKNNYHQFQPLFYQVATAFLEPSAIAFPLRKVFQGDKNICVRVAEVLRIDTANNQVATTLGVITYDDLVIATGADTNYFGLQNIQKNAMPMKSVGEALALRNAILKNLEDAVTTTDPEERAALMNIAVVGGGPTGVEVAGTLAEMKRYILPKDYPEMDFSQMTIRLYENSPEVLGPMSVSAQTNAKRYLEELGVEVWTGVGVADFDGHTLTARNGTTFVTKTVIWAAGVRATVPEGLTTEQLGRANRILIDEYCRVKGCTNVYAIGDVAMALHEADYPNGHPQVAPVAMQMGDLLSQNLAKSEREWQIFRYHNQGAMATVGRNKAVVDLPQAKFQGFFAWVVWMFVHLISIMGMKNRVLIFINWVWNYITFDQSLRLMIRPREKQRN